MKVLVACEEVKKCARRFVRWGMENSTKVCLPRIEQKKNRAKTFPGIAKAMAEQWGGLNDAL